MTDTRLEEIVDVKHAPLPHGAHTGEVVTDVSSVQLTGDVDQVSGTLKLDKQVSGGQRDLGVADRITAGVQNCPAEQVWVAEHETQRHAGASRKSGNVEALRIHGVLSNDVFGREQRQRLAPTQRVLIVARSRG